MNWNDLTAAYKRKSTGISTAPVYGILNTFNGRRLEKTFDAYSEAQAYIKNQRLSHFFRVTVVERRRVK